MNDPEFDDDPQWRGPSLSDDSEYGEATDHPHDQMRSDTVNPNVLMEALAGLQLLGSDPYLRMQVTNVAIVDAFLTGLETDLMHEHAQSEGTPVMSAMFLSAQSQMWIFAAYELLRTWRARAKDALKLAKSGGLPLKVAALRQPQGFRHMGAEARADQLERFAADRAQQSKTAEDLRRSHIVFRRLEALRVSMAKHEVSGRPKMVAFAPGYARIDMWTGSMRWEVSAGRNIYDEISRRNIADELRAIPIGDTPAEEDLEAFDTMLKVILSGRSNFDDGGKPIEILVGR